MAINKRKTIKKQPSASAKRALTKSSFKRKAISAGAAVIMIVGMKALSAEQRQVVNKSQVQIEQSINKIKTTARTKAEADSLFNKKIEHSLAELNKKAKPGQIFFGMRQKKDSLL